MIAAGASAGKDYGIGILGYLSTLAFTPFI